MTKDEILKYIGLCVSYKHNNDISPYITKSACEKENLLFENAIEFLEKIDKEIAELHKVKELLNEFMQISKASDEDFEHDYSELIAETEQFLKVVSE